jgi:MoaA/NifB/PqqE/SkfB family radical SAM enzyme
MAVRRIRKVLDAFVFNRHATPKKLLNLALVFVQHQFIKNSKVVGYPVRLVLEPTNHCNLSCPLCPAARDNKDHERGMMKLQDFKKIIDEVGDYLFEIDLYDFGESLLNHQIYDMIEYASSRNIRTNLSSNLNVGDMEKLVKSGLSNLVASIDGTSQEIYKQYRVHGDYDKVMGNVKALIAAKKAHGKSEPNLIWRFIVMQHNQHQVPELYQKAAELGMEVDLLPMRLSTAIDHEFGQDNAEVKSKWLPTIERFKRAAYKSKKPPRVGPKTCLFLWNQATINWNGTVTPCCAIFDYESHSFGSVREPGGLMAAWNSDTYQRARKMVKDMNPDAETDKKFDMCAGCIKGGFVDV